jgi:hypothetical protein
MKSTPQVFERFLIFDCLTRKLFLLMLLVNRSFCLSCPNRWGDVAGADVTQGTGKTSSRTDVYVWLLDIALAAFYTNYGREQAH